ncbi:MAG TPA: DNA N-6-adenine-methyltransferase [Smithella sp.]|nr:DNA N-6-adenine-methyltransferase [Smithella sp.]
MSHWEKIGKSDEWYTPKYIFDALNCEFDMDVAAPLDRTYCHVPAKEFITEDALSKEWTGFVWMNPPFGGRNGIIPWLKKMVNHNNGIALTPDRTSSKWWQYAAQNSNCILFVDRKIKFIKPDGSLGRQPSTGTCLFAYGNKAERILVKAQYYNGLGKLLWV